MDDRVARERAFHDSRFTETAPARAADRFYAINRASVHYFRRAIDAAAPGTRILEYGCGDGAHAALYAAERGHAVTAIDISPVAIARAQETARRRGLADHITFSIMNAEELEFDADAFDLVCGLGVLHHLDLRRSLAEVARVTAPHGGAVFVEPLGHNPLLRLYRRLTPAQRTADERPLRLADLAAFEPHFGSVTVSYFHLLSLLALPWRDRAAFEPLLRGLDAADRVLFLTPARRWAWMAGIRVSSPLS